MAKRKKVKSVNNKKNISEIEQERTGGAVALTGFEYQCLYSCYLLLEFLKTDSDKMRFEGIEDIDTYMIEEKSSTNHIQLKYSKDRQDASFFKSILKNYLEIYLLDNKINERQFTLVYDFDVANGNLSKLIDDRLDKQSLEYWEKIIDSIREDNQDWNWKGFDCSDFIDHLKFERIERDKLIENISILLIEKFKIVNGNELIYAHSLFYLCFSKMRSREYIDLNELNLYIQILKDNINKGVKNPAYHWLKKIDFKAASLSDQQNYYEGKKAEPSDIIAGLPIRRLNIESAIEKSITENTITIIRASSGQGKTTMAWQVAYNLRDLYPVYQLTWCMESKEIDNIVEFTQSRVKVGEIPLIVIDNLNIELKEWNQLALQLRQKIGVNYKLLITTREDDWYAYSGDQSNLRSLNQIELYLDELQAEQIFLNLKKNGKIHLNINNWQSAWELVKDRGLLIEYIYLLTHGEMLENIISSQLKAIIEDTTSPQKSDILRKICFADTIGVQLRGDKLAHFYQEKFHIDISGMLTSLENEFSIKTTTGNTYITGLHPVRSQHVLNCLNSYISISETILEMLDIIDSVYISKLYANLPSSVKDEKEKFYRQLVKKTAGKDYRYYVNAIQGLYSGTTLEYFKNNKKIFDDANKHGGLVLFLGEICPYTKFEKFDVEIKTLNSMYQLFPKNKNIRYLCNLADSIEKLNIKIGDYYFYAYYLFEHLKSQPLNIEKQSYSSLVYWCVNIDTNFCLLNTELVNSIWDATDDWTLESIAELMLSWYLGDEKSFLEYIDLHKNNIIQFLKKETKSMKLYEEENSIYVEYLLLPDKIKDANSNSVERLELICKTLPIYDYYCSQAIMPQLSFLNDLCLPDESIKKMPRRNLILGFHEKFVNLWSNTITSMYEFTTIFEWLHFWENLRKNIVSLFKKNVMFLNRKMNQQMPSSKLIAEIDGLRNAIKLDLIMERPTPHQNRPFEKKAVLPKEIPSNIKEYFNAIQNYIDQMPEFLQKEQSQNHLAMINIRSAKSKLNGMQNYFDEVSDEMSYYSENYNNIKKEETQWLERLIGYNFYYLEHEKVRSLTQHSLDKWMILRNEQQLVNMKIAVEESDQFGIAFQFPLKMIDDGTLFTLPLLVNNIDFSDEETILKIVISLIPLINFDIHFILIISTTLDVKIVKQKAIRISKDYLEIMQKCLIEENEEILTGTTTRPLPCNVQDAHLNCFSQHLKIENVIPNEMVECFEKLINKLWEYSQFAKYITEDTEKRYLVSIQNTVKKDIEALVENMKICDHHHLFEKSLFYVNQVLFEDYYFSEEDLNYQYDEIIKYSKQNLL